MTNKIHIIGASFSGLACAEKLAQLLPDTQIILIDKDQSSDYIPNGLNDYLRGNITHLSQAMWQGSTPSKVKNIVRLYAEVITIDPEKKELILKKDDQALLFEPYQLLVCAMGSEAKSNFIKGSDRDGVITTKSYRDSREALAKIEESQKILVVGAGVIGLDFAYSLAQKGKEVTLVEAANDINFHQFDTDMIAPVRMKIAQKGISLVTHARVTEIRENQDGSLSIFTDCGQSYTGDIVVLAVNFRPNSLLLENIVDCHLDRTIKVDSVMRTSDPNIYAIGDLIALKHSVINFPYYSPLISHAIRTGQYLAYHLAGISLAGLKMTKLSGSFNFDYYQSSAGLTEEEGSLYHPLISYCYKAKSSKDGSLIWIKLIAKQENGQLVGCQMISECNNLLLANYVSQAITLKQKDSDLAFHDFIFLKGEGELAYHLHEAAVNLFEKRISL
ncbi:pyridine nucleotide-disulfide oxidoreductase [Streptococcus pseudoporcinus]|uniref:Pyridine nucleotide-disulfide oxidoreductase n=1 Tax=Streptococcus pseudoporcinus TaxID=361101 RepID=A0A4V6Z3R4_9STRE|nr:FAD/NAD(P)-binding oxidoreductase [Streptococcus pseudoporcinus]VTS15707.1 pyridine nucleotide-disulfide oxidoreductase [Streptococcus pseudoporcinus]